MQFSRAPKPPPGAKPGEQSYRLYFLDGAGRRIVNSRQFFAGTDEEAIKVAEAWQDGRKMELWQRARIVKECH